MKLLKHIDAAEYSKSKYTVDDSSYTVENFINSIDNASIVGTGRSIKAKMAFNDRFIDTEFACDVILVSETTANYKILVINNPFEEHAEDFPGNLFTLDFDEAMYELKGDIRTLPKFKLAIRSVRSGDFEFGYHYPDSWAKEAKKYRSGTEFF